MHVDTIHGERSVTVDLNKYITGQNLQVLRDELLGLVWHVLTHCIIFESIKQYTSGENLQIKTCVVVSSETVAK